jgi:hypothetical protein
MSHFLLIYSISNTTSGYFRMRVTAESTANSGTPKVENVCFVITYGQYYILHLSRAEFGDIIVDAWVGRSTK